MDPRASEAVGRNSPCPCGSGRKYKHCCRKRAAAPAAAAPALQSLLAWRALFEQARQLYREGRLAEADSVCRELLCYQPAHISALALSARIARDGGRVSEALALLTRATLAAPHDALAHRELGVLQLQLGQAPQALASLERSLALDPRTPAHADLAVALLRLGRIDAAEAACRRMLEADPRHLPALITLAECQRRRGRAELAGDTLASALQLEPGSVEALVALADLQTATGDAPAAAARYRQALAGRVRPAPIYARLARALQQTGDVQGAIEALQLAVAAEPAAVEYRCALGQTLLECGRATEALTCAEQATALKADAFEAQLLRSAALATGGDVLAAAEALAAACAPTRSAEECLTLIANHLIAAGYAQQALECLRCRLTREPQDAATAHAIAALSGTNPASAPGDFVRRLFDSYAEEFDVSLLRGLAYTVPRELVQAVCAAGAAPPQPWDVLDLGCGTGLVGAELGTRARTLVGVDLSANMIERSRSRGVYTQLLCADILEVLARSPPASFDLVTAGDLFIYVGSLDAVVPAVRSALRAGGCFAFSVESLENGRDAGRAPPQAGYWLHSRARYAHRRPYLEELAARNAFDITLTRDIRVRFEDRRPVPGWAMLWSVRTTATG